MSQLGADEAATRSSQRYEARATPTASFKLEVVSGEDTGTCLVLRGDEPGPVLVGTSSACALRLTDREVSRRHLALEIEGSRLRASDLQSTNGTRINGVQVADAWLLGGETVSVGSTIFRAIILDAPSRADLAPLGPPRATFGGFLGQSPELQRVYPLIERLASSDVPVVIEGETGTGKEVLAEAMHEHSPRASKPYVILDCTTLPANLIEAELFGHERGSFTGAVGQRRGVFEEADGGTLFIDEIGDLDISLQPKLLRVLERGELRRVGGAQRIRVDVRVIAATRRDLDQAVETGAFRDDLFHRLAVGRLTLPPLRKRQGDIAFLAQHFWRELAPSQPLPAALLARWEAYAWPGNVRELRNTIARQIATGGLEQQSPAPADQVTATPEVRAVLQRAEAQLRDLLWSHSPIPITRVTALDVLQRAHVERALLEHGGSIDAAARSLGVGKRYLHMLKAGARKR